MAARLDTIQTIEIAEGVEIRQRVAGPVPRAYALLIDFCVQIAFYIVVGIAIGIIGIFAGGAISDGILNLVVFFVSWFYHVPFEASRKGASPGKRAMGLRVVRMSGAPISFQQSVIRNFMRIIDILPGTYAFGLISCTMTKKFQRLGDLAADTVVIYDDRKEIIAANAQPEDQSHIQPLAPSCALGREEQRAIVLYSDRLKEWSDERQQEMANHASALTQAEGAEGARRLLGMARWIRTSS